MCFVLNVVRPSDLVLFGGEVGVKHGLMSCSGDEMGADAGGIEGIVSGNLVLPDVRDAHKLAAFVVVFNVDTMLDIGGFANVDNLFGVSVGVLAASRGPLGEARGGLVGVEVCGSALLVLVWSTASEGGGGDVPVVGQGRCSVAVVSLKVPRC